LFLKKKNDESLNITAHKWMIEDWQSIYPNLTYFNKFLAFAAVLFKEGFGKCQFEEIGRIFLIRSDFNGIMDPPEQTRQDPIQKWLSQPHGSPLQSGINIFFNKWKLTINSRPLFPSPTSHLPNSKDMLQMGSGDNFFVILEHN